MTKETEFSSIVNATKAAVEAAQAEWNATNDPISIRAAFYYFCQGALYGSESTTKAAVEFIEGD